MEDGLGTIASGGSAGRIIKQQLIANRGTLGGGATIRSAILTKFQGRFVEDRRCSFRVSIPRC